MRHNSRDRGGGFVVFLIIGLIIKFFWWLVAAAVAVGLLFVLRAVVRKVRERQAAAAREAEQLAYRAERQHQWACRGDSRGIYGVAGAELMRSIAPELLSMPLDSYGAFIDDFHRTDRRNPGAAAPRPRHHPDRSGGAGHRCRRPADHTNFKAITDAGDGVISVP